MAAEGRPDAAGPPEEAALRAVQQAEDPQEPAHAALPEDDIPDLTFAACDPQRTGTVPAWRVVQYLQELTGLSSEERRLQALRRRLDPEATGAALDLPTFRAAMRDWIASCRQEGDSQLDEEWEASSGDLSPAPAAEEGHVTPASMLGSDDSGGTDAMSPTEAAGLRSRAEQLVAQNATLQRDVELAEELNARLAEETAQLKAQLRCSQRALEQARAAAEELEDVKAVVKELEEENDQLRRQAHQLVRVLASSLPEQEQRCQCSAAASRLQEENQQLLAAEVRGLREEVQIQEARMADLELRCCSVLRSFEDEALAPARQRMEELMVPLEEFNSVVQELRQEMTRLRNQLDRLQGAWAAWLWCPRDKADIPAQPLGTEIGATCQETGEAEEDDAATAAPGAPARDGEEPAELRQCLGASGRLVALVLLVLVALVLLALLAVLSLGPFRWPQPQLSHRGLPPL